jgi:hypothetical protein
VDNVCVSKTVLKSKDVAAYSTVNKYTKLDPTLPRVTNVLCPNEGCTKNEKGSDKRSEKKGEEKRSDKDKEIICIRSDDINMKYMYLCAECDTTWSN